MQTRGFDRDYIFLTSMIRAMEARLLPPEMIGQMVSADDTEALAALVSRTVYRDFVRDRGKDVDIEGLVMNSRARLLEFYRKYAGDDIVEYICIESDYHNIKVLLKEKLLDRQTTVDLPESGMIGAGELREIFRSEQFSLLPEDLQKPVNEAVEAYYLYKKPVIIDLIMDRALYARLTGAGTEFISDYFRLKTDIANLLTAVRAGSLAADPDVRQYLFMPGGEVDGEIFLNDPDPVKIYNETAGLRGLTAASVYTDDRGLRKTVLERECDNLLIRFLQVSRYLIQGAEPAFAYYCAVETELKIISLIYCYIKGGRVEEMIRLRIPEPF